MNMRSLSLFAILFLALLGGPARADEYADTIQVFRQAGESGKFFDRAYGYAVFPNIGKGGVVLVGGAHGKGRVYERGGYIGESSMTQATFGPQLGGQVYSMIVFFEDKRALSEFTGTGFEFGAQASAVAITAGANISGGTTGATAGASGGQHDATTVGTNYYKGMAVYTVAKGGLMYEAALAGQKFSFTPAGRK
jgi:lipid-binding SYLF domain-containing protein